MTSATPEPELNVEAEVRRLITKDVEQIVFSKYKRDPGDTIQKKIERLARRVATLTQQVSDQRVRILQDDIRKLDWSGAEIQRVAVNWTIQRHLSHKEASGGTN